MTGTKNGTGLLIVGVPRLTNGEDLWYSSQLSKMPLAGLSTY